MIGIFGIVLATVVALLIAGSKHVSSIGNMAELDGSLVVLIAGFVCAVRGSLLWLLLSGAGLAELVVVIFRR